MKVLIIGGVAGGATAAARLRRLDEKAEIIIFEKGEYISFANCGLPYYIGDVIKDRSRLLVQTVEGMKKRFNIDVRVKSEVTKINKEDKTLTISSDGKEYSENYDYLVLSPGAKPIKPNIKGIDSERIYTLRNMADVDKIKNTIDDISPKNIAVIGGGFIGIEMAENLKHLGKKVSIIEMADQLMAPLDPEMARIIEAELMDNGINVILNDGVTSFDEKEDKTIDVALKSGSSNNYDMVILSIGVMPDTILAKEAGLELGQRGHIRVDDYMKTSDPSIYSVGDAVLVKNLITKKEISIPLAGPANRQARLAADNICGKKTKYKGVLGTSIIKIFNYTAATTGLNEKSLITEGIAYEKSYTHSYSHAGYYPGALPMTIKILFEMKTGKIFGAEIIGEDGVDKRIDVLATAIRHNLTVFDLEDLELAYAPPFSSAKDPVNMAGYAASNIADGSIKVIHFNEIDSINHDEFQLVDVRTKYEYDCDCVKDASNIPVDDIRDNLSLFDKNKKILIYCKAGLRGYIACCILRDNGFDVYNLSGGFETYKANKHKYGKGVEMDDSMMKLEKRESKIIKVDACGLQCPGPIMKVFEKINEIKKGEILEITVTDPAFTSDITAWCKRTQNTLISIEKEEKETVVKIKKGLEDGVVCETNQSLTTANGKTIVVFSGDLDKAIASFIIANGAAAMGRQVTMFFTFWGLNILRSESKVKVKKNLIEKMFGKMMPRGINKLKISKMNMGGMGTKMIKAIMKQKGVSSLEELVESAIKNNVKIVACAMSMDIMGIKQEELIDGVEIGGVGYYLGEAEESDTNLFI